MGAIEGIAYEEVIASAATIKAAADNAKGILEEVNAKMAAIDTDDVYKGAAATAIREKYQSLAKNYEGLYTELTAYSKFLEGTVETYKEADRVMAAKAEELLNSTIA